MTKQELLGEVKELKLLLNSTKKIEKKMNGAMWSINSVLKKIGYALKVIAWCISILTIWIGVMWVLSFY